MTYRLALLILTVLFAASGPSSSVASPAPGPRPSIDILVDGRRLPTYSARGTLYVEALQRREYEIRLRNPYPVRVAVALTVDGLNTIDARHTSAAAARKWVIEPYGTVTISGWQTSMTQARRFEFTTEERSYGAWLGKTNDLGIVSAVFYRERLPERVVSIERGQSSRLESPAPASQRDAERAPAGEAGPPPAAEAGANAVGRALGAGMDEYAATGIGRRTDHSVQEVWLDLESTPAHSVSIRYEYRAQLVRLGVLPAGPGPLDPLDRRERARGFDAFCPEPKQ